MARKNGLSLALKQFQKDINKATQKESSHLSKEMQEHYKDKYVETTGARRPHKKAREKVDYPWSGLSYSQRILRNSKQLNSQAIQGIEQVLRKGGSKTQVISLLLDLENRYNDRHDILIRTELWHMDLLGELDGMKANKVKLVKYISADDPRVCEECRALESYNDGIYPIMEAPLLPRHPRCRCHLIPYEL